MCVCNPILRFPPCTRILYSAGGPNMTCVAETIQRIRQLQPDCPTTHLISIGGWNAPHPDTSRPPSEVYAAWHKWNTETIVSAKHDFYGKLSAVTTRAVPYKQSFSSPFLSPLILLSRLLLFFSLPFSPSFLFHSPSFSPPISLLSPMLSHRLRWLRLGYGGQ